MSSQKEQGDGVHSVDQLPSFRDTGAEFAEWRDALLRYLTNGVRDYTYKKGIPFVQASDVRELALKAGYPELALTVGWSGHTDLIQSDDHPQKAEDRFVVGVHAPNRYGLEIGRFDGVELFEWVARTQKPDLGGNVDPLRDSVLSRIDEFNAVKKELKARGKKWFSLEAWRFHVQGDMDFLLNPYNQEMYSANWYTIDDLRLWGADDPKNPVLRKNQRSQDIHNEGESYQDEYKKELRLLNQRINNPPEHDMATRLMTIALTRCPFKDMVSEYKHLVPFQ